MNMLDAVVFDFDGVIVDTEFLHYKAFQAVLEPRGMGYPWDLYVSHYIGFDDRDGFREAYRSQGVDLIGEDLAQHIGAKAAAFLKLVEEEGVSAYKGVVDLIRHLGAHVPVGLCSGALTSDIEPILAKLALEDAFAAVVTADDVEVSKPDPSSYVLALARLQEACGKPLRADRSVAIEDTPTGLQAARGAGMIVLGVTHNHTASRLEGAARIVDSFAGLAYTDFEALVEKSDAT